MVKLIIMLSLVGMAFGSFGERSSMLEVSTSRPGVTDSGLLDCNQLPNGSHNVHPYDCTRFIQCDNGRAQDMPCPDCPIADPQCLGRPYTEFDGSAPSCVWPNVSACRNVQPTTSEPEDPETPQPTTEEPEGTDIPQPTTVEPQDPETPSPTTQEPEDPETQTPPPSGEGCDATNCTISVTCRDYTFCERIDETEDPDLVRLGKLVTVLCDHGLWPVGITTDNSNGAAVIGACLPWTEVPAERKEEILRDCTEPYCELIAVGGACTSDYRYRNDQGVLSALKTCPRGLIVDVAKRGCVAGSCA